MEIQLDFSGQHAPQTSVLLLFAAFLISFLFIRTSARLMRSPKVPWWPGSVTTEGGLHIHHMVFGIVLMLIGGTLGFALEQEAPWIELSAVAFGIGAGLTFDEFALWVHLEDVYWSEEGRQSVDAAIVAIAFVGLVLTGAISTNLDTGSPWLIAASVLVIAVGIVTTLIAFSKFRLAHGMFGLVFWPLALWGACRLAKPNSPWAKRFYGERNPDKQARAEARYGSRRIDRFKDRVRDAIGGQPTSIEQREHE
ncbi:MAG TPA: hypothetical protein VKA47_03400 [Solirubrobacterales bacterium]|nr:hypothetical protein [Solirubrobacterales bacterium]